MANQPVGRNLHGVYGSHFLGGGGQLLQIRLYGLFIRYGNVEAFQIGNALQQRGKNIYGRYFKIHIPAVKALFEELVVEIFCRERMA